MADCFWFGTEDRMMWFPSPLAGAGSNPSGWSATGTTLQGGGWGVHSWDTHKEYSFQWSDSSAARVAQLMKSYRDGTYGRGLLYFLDPSSYEVNILPARWADPSMALDDESPSLLYGVDPTPVTTSGGGANQLPIRSAMYSITTTAASSPAVDDSIFIPIPKDYTLHMGAFYSYTGTGGVWVTPVAANGSYGTSVRLTPLANNATTVSSDMFSGDLRGVRVWLGRSSSATSTVTIAAMSARLVKSILSAPQAALAVQSPWYGGQGHSGARFLQPPTYITNNSNSGGRIGFAATFIEVGSWVYG